jgi:hypothetical protein
MIVADGKAGGSTLGKAAEALAHTLPERLERLEPVSPAAGVNAHALGRALGRLLPAVPAGTDHRLCR